MHNTDNSFLTTGRWLNDADISFAGVQNRPDDAVTFLDGDAYSLYSPAICFTGSDICLIDASSEAGGLDISEDVSDFCVPDSDTGTSDADI